MVALRFALFAFPLILGASAHAQNVQTASVESHATPVTAIATKTGANDNADRLHAAPLAGVHPLPQ
jgi:hypothetical protein